MKKYSLVLVLLLAATIASAGKYKLSTAGKGDVYVPTLETDGKTLVVDGIIGPGAVPIGGMLVVMPTAIAAAWQPPATGVIKDGFMRADGATITALHKSQGATLVIGTILPDMVSRYPRGNTTSGTVNGSNTVSVSIPAHYHNSFSLDAAGHSLGTTWVGIVGAAAVAAGGEHLHPVQMPRLNSLSSFRTSNSSCHRDDVYNIAVQTDYSQGAADYTSYVANDHQHNIYGATNIAHSHPESSVSGSVGNQGGSNGDGPFGGTISPTSGSAGNNEPAYAEVVWVIRVK